VGVACQAPSCHMACMRPTRALSADHIVGWMRLGRWVAWVMCVHSLAHTSRARGHNVSVITTPPPGHALGTYPHASVTPVIRATKASCASFTVSVGWRLA
jgi:hypothetical protein